jgi:hypothetical protein
MRFVTTAIAISILAAATTAGRAEQSALQVPQSIRLQHQQIIDRLASLAKSNGPAAAPAQKALVFLKDHYAREEAFVLPPLSLLPRIAKGDIAKDMEPAIAMADRAKAAAADLQSDHIQITTLMNELIEAGRSTRNEELVRFATRVANQSLNDMEVAHPTTIVIGDYLRLRLKSP